MRIEDFDYDLDESRIAQYPEEKRDWSKLMVINKESGNLVHDRFYNVKTYLKSGDVLVLNDTKVLPARLFGNRPNKKEKIEVLMYKHLGSNRWECLVRPGKKMKIGNKIIFANGLMEGKVYDITEDGSRRIEFFYEGIFEEVLDQLGEMPLPPYISKKLEDKERYQTVYARNSGSAAAPTAGFHFTKDLLQELRHAGVEIAYLTLHVGLGTFRPVQVEKVEDHVMHSEYYDLSQEAADIINRAKEEKRRVIAVGTTTTRTLESVAQDSFPLKAGSGWTNIFIKPGFDFKVIDGLITNFHLPKSTLLMLVSAFSDLKLMKKAYEEAKEKDYRFFSFGDSMMIV